VFFVRLKTSQMRPSKGRAQGGVKKRDVSGTASQKRQGKAIDAIVSMRNAARRQNQISDATTAFMLYNKPRRPESKFYDPWTQDGVKTISLGTNSTLADGVGSYVFTGAAGVPGAVVLNQIPQGTQQRARLSRRAQMTGVYIKGHFVTGGAANRLAKCSISLVHQTTPNNAVAMPNFTEIWVAQQQNAQRNVDNNDKLKVVKTIGPHVLTGGTTTPNDNSMVDIDEYIDLTKKEIITSWTQADTTGVYGNMESGALLLYGLSNATVVDGFVFVGSIRVYFTDY